MFTLLTDGDRSRFDDVLRIARPDDPVYVATRGWMLVGRPALGHDSRMAAAQPSAAQRVTVEEDQTGTRGDAAFAGMTVGQRPGAAALGIELDGEERQHTFARTTLWVAGVNVYEGT